MIDYFKLNLFETIQQTEASLRFGIIQTTNRNLPCIIKHYHHQLQ